MVKLDGMAIAKLLSLYEDCSLLYTYEEDMLGLKNKVPIDISDVEAGYLYAYATMINDLQYIYMKDEFMITDFLLTCNEMHPFNGMEPYRFVKKNPARVLEASFFVRCLRTYTDNQLRLGDLT